MEFAYIKKKKTFFQWKNIFPFFTLSFNPSLPLSSPISPLILDLWGHDHLPCCKFLTNVCVTYLLLSSFICLSTVPDVSTYQHVPFSDFEVSLAVDYHSATEVHHATDFTFDLERTTTSVSQPRIFLCTDLQRNRASAPTAQTFSLIEPTKSVPLLTVRSWSLSCVSEARFISLWSPALPTLQAVHAFHLPSIFHVVFWVCALFQGCAAINCGSRAFIQGLSPNLSPRYFSVQRTTTSAAVHSFYLSWFVPHVLSLRTFPVKSMRTTICASWRFLF